MKDINTGAAEEAKSRPRTELKRLQTHMPIVNLSHDKDKKTRSKDKSSKTQV